MRLARGGGVPVRDSQMVPISLQAAGLQEGDYIVSVNGQPCKWWKHAEVVAQLKGVGDEGVTLQVVTLLPSTQLPCTVSPRGPGTGGSQLLHPTLAPGLLLGP